MVILASVAMLASFSPAAGAQTYVVVLSVNDARPMGQAVLSLIRSYPVTITYEDPRYEYAGDLREITRQVSKTRDADVTTVVPKGGALQATYDVSQDTGEPVDMADAIQKLVDASNQARQGGHFEVVRSGETFHVVPTEVRDDKGHWVRQQSVLDTPITFSSDGERDGFELIEAILQEVSDASGQKVGGGLAIVAACRLGCVQNKRTIDARNESARDVLIRLLSSLNPRYTWVLYYEPTERFYWFNLVLGAERAEPNIEQHRPRPKPGDPTPGVPFNLASAR
jgi:hypothetical protein